MALTKNSWESRYAFFLTKYHGNLRCRLSNKTLFPGGIPFNSHENKYLGSAFLMMQLEAGGIFVLSSQLNANENSKFRVGFYWGKCGLQK